jgi:YceI-like domain
VLHGTGGMQPLEDDDKANIEETIDSEVLLGMEIAFRSTAVDIAPDGNTLNVQGQLTLVGVTHELGFDVAVGPGGELTAKTVVKQSDWGMKPYSALFGALKVADEVEIEVDASEERSLAESVATAPPRRAAIIDPGVSSLLWALLFGLYLLFGMAAVGISWGESLVLSSVVGFFIFLLVRTRGIGLEDQSR